MVKLRDVKAAGNHNADSVERLASADATRGLFLLLLVTSGFGLREMLNHEHWRWITEQWVHRDWEGCSLWDLLQPAFLFIVGVAMPYSYANRQSAGQGWPRQFLHAVMRAILLVVIGIYLDSMKAADNRLVFDPRGDLQQIGIAYLLAFIVLPMGKIVQGMTVAFLLIGHTAAYVIYAFAGGQELWSRTQNVGSALDAWMHLGVHPQSYVTMNAVAATAIVLIGVLIGGLIRSGLTPGAKVAVMTGCSLLGILVGWLLSGGDGWIDAAWFKVIPMVKRIETLTFVLTAVGWTMLVFTYFYLLMDGFTLRAWAVPITLLGRNSLILYVTYTLFRAWAVKSASLVLPASPPWAVTLRPLFVELIVFAIFWLFCLWLYCRRIFVKV